MSDNTQSRQALQATQAASFLTVTSFLDRIGGMSLEELEESRQTSERTFSVVSSGTILDFYAGMPGFPRTSTPENTKKET